MADLNSALARVGVTGIIWKGEVGAAFPVVTTELTLPSTGWVDLGAVSDEGLTETRSADRTSFTPWQSTSPFRTVTTSAEKAFNFTLWQTQKESVGLYYEVSEEDMTETAADSGIITFDEPDRPAINAVPMIFDIFDGDNQRRFECPRLEARPNGDIIYGPANIIGYPLTAVAYPVDGVSIRRYFKEGWGLS